MHHQEIFLYANLWVSAPKILWVSVPPSMVCGACKSPEILIIIKISRDLHAPQTIEGGTDTQRLVYCRYPKIYILHRSLKNYRYPDIRKFFNLQMSFYFLIKLFYFILFVFLNQTNLAFFRNKREERELSKEID